MRLAALLVGLLTLGQEVDRLVDMLRYEEAGVVLDGRHVSCATVEVLAAGGLVLKACTVTTPVAAGDR